MYFYNSQHEPGLGSLSVSACNSQLVLGGTRFLKPVPMPK